MIDREISCEDLTDKVLGQLQRVIDCRAEGLARRITMPVVSGTTGTYLAVSIAPTPDGWLVSDGGDTIYDLVTEGYGVHTDGQDRAFELAASRVGTEWTGAEFTAFAERDDQLGEAVSRVLSAQLRGQGAVEQAQSEPGEPRFPRVMRDWFITTGAHHGRWHVRAERPKLPSRPSDAHVDLAIVGDQREAYVSGATGRSALDQRRSLIFSAWQYEREPLVRPSCKVIVLKGKSSDFARTELMEVAAHSLVFLWGARNLVPEVLASIVNDGLELSTPAERVLT